MYTNREEKVSEIGIIPLGLTNLSLTYIVRKGKKNKLRSTFIKAKNYRYFHKTALTMTYLELIGQVFTMLKL